MDFEKLNLKTTYFLLKTRFRLGLLISFGKDIVSTKILKVINSSPHTPKSDREVLKKYVNSHLKPHNNDCCFLVGNSWGKLKIGGAVFLLLDLRYLI